MDKLGYFILTILIIIFISSQFFFIKKTKNLESKKIKHNILSFIICLFSPIFTFVLWFCFEMYILEDLFQFNIENTFLSRLFRFQFILLINALLNYFILKFMFNKIQNKNLNLIDSIGSE